MKKTISVVGLSAIVISFMVMGCQKNDSTSSVPISDSTVQSTVLQNANDQTLIQNDEEYFEQDISTALANSAHNLDGTKDSSSYDFTTLPSVTIDKSPIRNGIKKINLEYAPSYLINGIKKSGLITLELLSGTKWTDKDAVLKETFDSVTITINNKTRSYKIIRYLTNKTGGSRWQVSVNFPFSYAIRVQGSVKYDNNLVGNYWIKRKNSFTSTSPTLGTPTIFVSDGDSIIGNDTCLMGGTSRYNNGFLVKSKQTFIAAQACNYVKPYLGTRTYTNTTDNSSFTILYGVDAAGIQVNNQATPCSSLYGYRLSWTKVNGQLTSEVVAYK